jgi:hypothetical protein
MAGVPRWVRTWSKSLRRQSYLQSSHPTQIRQKFAFKNSSQTNSMLFMKKRNEGSLSKNKKLRRRLKRCKRLTKRLYLTFKKFKNSIKESEAIKVHRLVLSSRHQETIACSQMLTFQPSADRGTLDLECHRDCYQIWINLKTKQTNQIGSRSLARSLPGHSSIFLQKLRRDKLPQDLTWEI